MASFNNYWCYAFLLVLLNAVSKSIASNASLTNDDEEDYACYLKNEETKAVEECKLSDHTLGCQSPSNSPNPTQKEERDIFYSQQKYNDTSSLINISIPHVQSDSLFILLKVMDLRGLTQCLTFTCYMPKAFKNEETSLYMKNVAMPNGNFSVHCFSPNSTECQDNTGVLLTQFEMPQHGSPAPANDLQTTDASNIVKRAVTCGQQCYSQRHKFTHEFDGRTGLLRFFINFPIKDFCDEEQPIKLMVQYTHGDPEKNTRTNCESMLSFGPNNFQTFRCIFDFYKPYVEFQNLPTGCYTIRVAPGCFHQAMWLEAENFVDMNDWQADVLLRPGDHESSLQVKWNQPDYPFNFTRWWVILWHMSDYNVSCVEHNDPRGRLGLIEAPHVITNNSITFYDLSDGFYCAKITPLDSRCPFMGCPLDDLVHAGCTPIGSETIRVLAQRTSRVIDDHKVDVGLMIVLVLVGVTSAVCIALLCCRFNPISTMKQPVYKLVTKIESSDNVVVLLVWTKYTPEKRPQMDSVIKALKKLLKEYCKCTVYDYLEPAKLPRQEREKLFKHDVAWIQSQLISDIKKVFVATEGAALLQRVRCKESDFAAMTETMDDLDSRLFPFVLRHIQDSIRMASDYQRVFQVCFTGFAENDAILEGIVSNVRFNLPEHLRQLRLRIHGLSEEAGSTIPQPTPEQLRDLHTAIYMAKSFV